MEEVFQQGFDLQVTHRDEKTGLVMSSNPYTLRVLQDKDGGKMRLWERPIGSGNLWDKKGNPIGRWLVDESTKRGKFIKGEPHTAFTPPPTEDQKLARSLTEKDSRIAALEKELQSMKLEKVESKKQKGS